MISKSLVAAAAALVFSGASLAGTVVTLNPQATNGGAGQLASGVGEFQTTGGTLQLGKISPSEPSVLTIFGNTGFAGFQESGRIYLKTFEDNNGDTIASSGLSLNSTAANTNYSLYIEFSLTGVGQWLSTTAYAASPASLSFTATLYGDDDLSTAASRTTLGALTLLGSQTSYALAFTSGDVTSTTGGTANTAFSATLGFDPAAGTTGADGFFKAPSPFAIDIAIGSIGGNNGNTTYSVAGTTVTVTTPTVGSSSTGNFTFVNDVPEPGALSLAGLALFGLGVMGRKRKSRA